MARGKESGRRPCDLAAHVRGDSERQLWAQLRSVAYGLAADGLYRSDRGIFFSDLPCSFEGCNCRSRAAERGGHPGLSERVSYPEVAGARGCRLGEFSARTREGGV